MTTVRGDRSRRRTEAGASLVEFAIIMPVLFMLLIGMITGGITLSRQNSVENAVREATRFGAVIPDFDDLGNRTALYDQVVAAATGDLDPGVDGRFICVALIDADNTWDYSFYGATAAATSGVNAAAPSQCTDGFDPTLGSGTRRIWVQAKRKSDIQGVFWTVPVSLASQSLTRYER